MQMTAEQLRERILELIKGWLTHSNAARRPDAVMVLDALAGDIQVIDLEVPDPPNTCTVCHVNPVCPEDGQDTCSDCVRRI